MHSTWGKDEKKYLTHLKDREWELIEKHLKVSYDKEGRPPKYNKTYDLLTTSTENFIYLATSRVMLKTEYA